MRKRVVNVNATCDHFQQCVFWGARHFNHIQVKSQTHSLMLITQNRPRVHIHWPKNLKGIYAILLPLCFNKVSRSVVLMPWSTADTDKDLTTCEEILDPFS